MVENPARRGQLNGEKYFALSLFAPDHLGPRDGFSRLVPLEPAHFPHSS